MATSLVRIGNSRGVRIPRTILSLYRWDESTALEFETKPEGLLIRSAAEPAKLSFEASYKEMVEEAAEREEWKEWDVTLEDGLD